MLRRVCFAVFGILNCQAMHSLGEPGAALCRRLLLGREAVQGHSVWHPHCNGTETHVM